MQLFKSILSFSDFLPAAFVSGDEAITANLTWFAQFKSAKMDYSCRCADSWLIGFGHTTKGAVFFKRVLLIKERNTQNYANSNAVLR